MWDVERRGPGRSREDRRRGQLEREAQGRTVKPVVLADELAARRHREHAMAAVGGMKVAAEPGSVVPGQGTTTSAGGRSWYTARLWWELWGRLWHRKL